MEVSREEMLEFAKQATFSLDDRLVPYDRETLRAESWLTGYEFAKRGYMKKQEEEEALAPVEPPVCGDGSSSGDGGSNGGGGGIE